MISVIPWDGAPISKAGFYSGVPMSAYHSGRLCVKASLSSGGMRTIFNKSEAHFFDRWPLNPNYDRSEDEDSPSMQLGRAIHHLLLGQPEFDREYIKPPDKCLNAKGEAVEFSLTFKAAREWKADMVKRGFTVLTEEQIAQIEGITHRLQREPLVGAGILNGLIEITGAWEDPQTGVWFLIRPDVIPTASGDFCDLKTLGRDVVSYSAMARAIGEHGYHMQAALVREGWERITGLKMKTFSFYFVETNRPYCARMVTLRQESLDLGMRQNRNAVARFVKAMNSQHWPGPGGLQEAVQYIDLADGKQAAIESELRNQGEERSKAA